MYKTKEFALSLQHDHAKNCPNVTVTGCGSTCLTLTPKFMMKKEKDLCRRACCAVRRWAGDSSVLPGSGTNFHTGDHQWAGTSLLSKYTLNTSCLTIVQSVMSEHERFCSFSALVVIPRAVFSPTRTVTACFLEYNCTFRTWNTCDPKT